MIIKIESPANENVRNFYPEQKLLPAEYSEYADAKSLRKSPLAEAIYDIGGIESVLIAPDMVSVIKLKNADWNDLSPQIMAEILDFVATGAAPVIDNNEKLSAKKEVEQQDELLKKINGLITARIRPALNRDGGDIELKGLEDGILWVQLTGKCAGCPYAMRTLKNGVEKIIKDYIPEITEVKPVGSEASAVTDDIIA